MQARFKASAEKAKTLSGLSNDELLTLYKFYKQVRVLLGKGSSVGRRTVGSGDPPQRRRAGSLRSPCPPTAVRGRKCRKDCGKMLGVACSCRNALQLRENETK
jgi:hypothetical protein